MKKFFIGLAIIAFMTSSLAANAAVLDFDDISTTDAADLTRQVYDGYNNFNWGNIFVIDAVTTGETTGYSNGLVSQKNVAFNGFGMTSFISSDKPFNFISAYFGSAWRDGLNIHLVGYSGKKKIYETTIKKVNTSESLLYVLDFKNINKLAFSTHGGTPNPAFSATGAQFVMDNITLEDVELPDPVPIPEPSSIIMGLIGLGSILRFRRK